MLGLSQVGTFKGAQAYHSDPRTADLHFNLIRLIVAHAELYLAAVFRSTPNFFAKKKLGPGLPASCRNRRIAMNKRIKASSNPKTRLKD